MTDLEHEIRSRLKAWQEAPEGSKQEAIAKTEYDRLSAIQAKAGKLTRRSSTANHKTAIVESRLGCAFNSTVSAKI